MRFLVDESVDPRLAAYLNEQGHEAVLVLAEPGQGTGDLDVLAFAAASGRILLTNDQGFGELVFRRRFPHSGVILFRMQRVPIEQRRAALDAVLRDHAGEVTQFLVVSEAGIRARRLDG